MAVIVTVPVCPPRLATPAEGVVIIAVLLEIQVAELVTLFPLWVAVKVTLAPTPPLLDKLIELPALDVTVSVEEPPVVDDCPTVTVVDPLTPPDVAVMVTPLLVFARPLIRPPLVTLTWLGTELVQLTPLTFPVVPSLKFPVAIICKLLPICRLGVGGVTVRLLRVGLTKKPWQPDRVKISMTVMSNSVCRPGLEIIANP